MSKEIASKTKRISQILTLLEQNAITVPDLATRFGVSIRTIQRDMGLLWQAQFPVVSPQQSVYALARGFSLRHIGLSCEEAALMVVSMDIAKQIGESFAPVLSQISKRFEPLSFDNCQFGVSKEDFSETDETAIMVLKCIKYHCHLRISLKNSKKSHTLYPYKMLRLWDKYYIASVSPGGECSYYSLENIGTFSLYADNKTSIGYSQFTPIPFAHWAIWQQAHQWVEDLNPDKEALTGVLVPGPAPIPAPAAQAPLAPEATLEQASVQLEKLSNPLAPSASASVDNLTLVAGINNSTTTSDVSVSLDKASFPTSSAAHTPALPSNPEKEPKFFISGSNSAAKTPSFSSIIDQNINKEDKNDI